VPSANADLPPPLHALIGKGRQRGRRRSPTQTSLRQKASGFSEDQLFELVISAAVGQSARLYEAGLAALAEATVNGGGPDNNAT